MVVDATGGEDGSEAAAERAVPVFGEERPTGSTYALEPSCPREWQAGEQVQPAGHDGMAAQLEGRAAGGPVQSARLKVGRADAGAHEEQEDQEEQEEQAVAVVATRPVEEIAERLSPLLCLLSKWRILSLRRGFDKIDSVGLEATVHPVVKESEMATWRPLMERLVRQRSTRQKCSALRKWRLMTTAADSTGNKNHFLARVVSAVVQKREERGVIQAQKRKEADLRRAFRAISDYALENAIQPHVRGVELDHVRAVEQRQRAKLSALFKLARAAYSSATAAAFAAEEAKARSAAIVADTARKQRQERQRFACRLLASVMGRRQNRQLLKAITTWRSSAAALPMKMESRIRSLLHGTTVVAVQSATQHRLRNKAQACRLLAAVTRRRQERGITRAVSTWRTAAATTKMETRARSAAVLALMRQNERRQQQQAVREAFGKIVFHGATVIAAETARKRRDERQQFACRLLASAVARRQNRRLLKTITSWRWTTVVAVQSATQHRLRNKAQACRLLAAVTRRRQERGITRALSTWRTAAVTTKVLSKRRSDSVLALLWATEKRLVRAAFAAMIHHGAMAIFGGMERERSLWDHANTCRLLAGVADEHRKPGHAKAMCSWRVAALASRALEMEKSKAAGECHKEVRSTVLQATVLSRCNNFCSRQVSPKIVCPIDFSDSPSDQG